MSKYSGIISIYDEQGGVVQERVLDADDIIKVLLLAPIEEEDLEKPPIAPETKGGPPRGCSKCSKPGHYKRNCPQAAAPMRVPPSEDALSPNQFDDLKVMVLDDLNALQIASELSMPIIEINQAIAARDYGWYLEHRV
jgi:hypothetical protein